MIGTASSKKRLSENKLTAEYPNQSIRSTRLLMSKDREKLVVEGFIRIYCISCILPDVLKDLCFKFYFIACGEWNMNDTNEDFQIDEENILSIKADKPSSFRTAFGTIVISKDEMFVWSNP